MAEQSRSTSTPSSSLSPPNRTTSTARFSLPTETFALATAFESLPDARIECDPAVANPTDHALVVIRTDEDERAVSTALRSDPSVAGVDCFDERPDGFWCRVTWGDRPRRIIRRFVAADVTLLSLRGGAGEWKLRLLSPDWDGIERMHTALDELGCDVECRSISTFDGGEDSLRPGLSSDQHEALVAAFEAGYYDIPRDVTLEELADELGISHQALSERFRRAYEGLITAELDLE
jgi:predicted DNA binding protein